MFTKHKASISLAACLLLTHNAYSMHKHKFDFKPLVHGTIKTAAIGFILAKPMVSGARLLIDAYQNEDPITHCTSVLALLSSRKFKTALGVTLMAGGTLLSEAIYNFDMNKIIEL